MSNSKYIAGRTFEYKVRDDYRGRGWYVFRMAGSHSVADLIAVKREQTQYIQCKHNDKPIDREETAKINAFMLRYMDDNDMFVIAKWNKTRRCISWEYCK